MLVGDRMEQSDKQSSEHLQGQVQSIRMVPNNIIVINGTTLKANPISGATPGNFSRSIRTYSKKTPATGIIGSLYIYTGWPKSFAPKKVNAKIFVKS